MNRKERFLTAVRVRQPDRVPMFDFLFQQPMYEALIGRRPGSYNARDAIACALALDHDAVWMPFGVTNGYEAKTLGPDTYIDQWGTTYRKTVSSWPLDAPIDYPIKSRSDLRNWDPPALRLPLRIVPIGVDLASETDGLALTGSVGGPFTMTWLLMGYEHICYTLHDDPTLLAELLRIVTDHSKEVARHTVEAGCHALWICDDLGDSSREFLRVPEFRKYVLPCIAELAEHIHNLGVPVLLHCCGHFSRYLDDLAQTRIAAIHPLQRTAGMDLRAVKEKYGRRFCIIGNIDSSRTLPYGTPEEVAAETRQAIDIAAPGGGYVVASDHSLHDGIPVENILALFHTAREYGGRFYSERGAS